MLELRDPRCPIFNLPWTVSLACSIDIRYNRLVDVGDLQDAIKLLRPVINLPHGIDMGMGALNQLAAFLHGRYKAFGTDGDLDEGIGPHREALGFFPLEHPNASFYLSHNSSR